MTSQDESAFHVSWPGIIALVVTAMGLILSRPSLDSPRPTPPAADGKPIPSGKSVPARLWQDPLAAALRGQQTTDKIANIVDSEHRPEPPKEDRDKKVLFLFDCVEPENTPEAAETRRRERYAVLSALNTAGYSPTQSDRIYSAALPRKEQSECTCVGNGQGGRAPDHPEKDRPIPYEWVQPLRDTDGPITHYQAVCVLWVSRRPDSKRQLDGLAGLSCLLKKALKQVQDPAECEFAITGRIGSTQLAAMLQEDAEFADPVRLYVTYSTAPSVRRTEQFSPSLLAAICNRKFAIEYVIDTDKTLADKLITELRLRRVDLRRPGSLAVIAEWDTEYGREMHNVFKDAAGAWTNDVRHYSYLRGLDGRELGGASGDEKGAQPGSGREETGGGQKPSPNNPTAKEGEGEPQIDYLRRLAQLMKADSCRPQAVGIVGSDVYDKFLLLKALRPVFPDAIFFTTDLDVRLLQSGDYPDTRNLLIASHYGLSLCECLQRKVAPFRSSYDTSSYLGCLRAVHFDKLKEHCQHSDQGIVKCIRPTEKSHGTEVPWNGDLLVPTKGSERMPIRLYEVGRSGAYELTLREGDRLEPPNPRIHPWLVRGVNPWYLLGIALLAGALLYPVSRPLQRFLNWAAAHGREFITGSLNGGQTLICVGAVFLGSGLVSLLLLIYYAHTHEDQESFELNEGISVWPTVVLRLLASGLCIYYIVNALRALKKRNDEINDNFALGYAKNRFPGVWAGLRESWRAWTEKQPEDGNVSALCQVFADHGVPWRRAFRTGLLGVINLGLIALLWFLFDPTVVQARGAVAQVCYYVVLCLTLVTVAGMLMFVVDGTLLSYRFVTAVAAQRVRKWPAKLLADGAKKWGLELPVAERQDVPEIWDVPRAVGQWLSIRLIDAVTYVVAARLIYYPFVVLLVLVVAQNPLFDNWHWNTPWALMAFFNAGVAVICAVLLQSAAKRARNRALSTLDDLLRARVGPAEDALRKRLVRIKSEIEGTNSGAFAGFSQNPVVGAVLLPLMGGGGLALLETVLRYLANP